MSNTKENSILGKFIYLILMLFLRPLIKLIWIKKVDGLKNIPLSGPYIIAANHQSYFDFISLMSVLPQRLYFLAAEKFFTSNFWKPIVEYTGQIRVDRDAEDKSQVITKATEILKKGKILALFPQGTRSRTGGIEKTFTGVARIALLARVSVVPVGIKGAFEVFPPDGKLKWKKDIEINIGQPLDFSKYYDLEKNPQLYRAITNEVMVEIARLAEKEYKEE
ncbi:MAG: 1-acylglycerol-3-phosphate O-acyltransferase [Parcubacteria group bacterium GW2011_GWE2_38_18]|nr:MAG: 1-acylglycerol-3-phosphate O-acyltransferase [Parcubacteria group bacterium GW2011_GWE2_38_18]